MTLKEGRVCRTGLRWAQTQPSGNYDLLLISPPENERSYLDAFARRGVRRAVRVIKRGMRGEARASVVLGVVALQQDCFVTFQSREIVPAMCRVVSEAVGFAHPPAI